MNAQLKLMVMAAGTGGHIFPGLAIAHEMASRGWAVSWLGTETGMEGEIVRKNGIDIDTVDFTGVRGKGLLHSAVGALKLGTSFLRCNSVISARKPDVVLGMGGYVTVPGGMAAKFKGIPLVVVNADSALLLSNRMLADRAEKILFGFDGDPGKWAAKAIVTGNPVRKEILGVEEPEKRFAGRTGPLKILVVGGSLGAQALNGTVPEALARIAPENRPEVIHQTGRAHIEAVKETYRNLQVDATVTAFIDDMASAYAASDLVLCRAGAITVSEITVAGVAAAYVPLVVQTTSHQRENAKLMEKLGAAVHLPQTELTPDSLAGFIGSLTREKCLEMAKAARLLGKRNATNDIADILTETALGRKK